MSWADDKELDFAIALMKLGAGLALAAAWWVWHRSEKKLWRQRSW